MARVQKALKDGDYITCNHLFLVSGIYRKKFLNVAAKYKFRIFKHRNKRHLQWEDAITVLEIIRREYAGVKPLKYKAVTDLIIQLRQNYDYWTNWQP